MEEKTQSAMKPWRLEGHKGEVTCCISSRARPGVIASSGEDGCICWFDLRCKDVLFTIEVGEEPVSSLCFKAGNEDIVYASSGTKVSCFDIHMAPAWKPLETYNYNKDEINQIVCSSKSNFLAAADDTGDVKIIDTHHRSLYKTLRASHTSICTSVQFLYWKPWTAITGGLDSKLVMWDFSKGRPYNIVNYGMPELDRNVSSGDMGQCLNPAFIHSIAVPEADMLVQLNKVCAIARGDGVVDVINLESELATLKSKGSAQPKVSQLRPKKNEIQIETTNSHSTDHGQGNRVQLDYTIGGHTAAASCVAFSLFGERGKILISGGNDAFVKLWDWSKPFQDEGTCCKSDLILDINVKKKINWLCTNPTDSDNLVVCDTSKVMKVYTVS